MFNLRRKGGECCAETEAENDDQRTLVKRRGRERERDRERERERGREGERAQRPLPPARSQKL